MKASNSARKIIQYYLIIENNNYFGKIKPKSLICSTSKLIKYALHKYVCNENWISWKILIFLLFCSCYNEWNEQWNRDSLFINTTVPVYLLDTV